MLGVSSRYNFVWFLVFFSFLIFSILSLYILYNSFLNQKFDWRFLAFLFIYYLFITMFKVTEIDSNLVTIKTLFGVKKIAYNEIVTIEKYHPAYAVISGYELTIEYGKSNHEIIPLGSYSNFRELRETLLFYYNLNTGKSIENFK